MFEVDDLVAWAKAFALTELIETPIYRVAVPTTVLRGLAASAITHPFVWFFFPWIGDLVGASYLTTSVASEIFAWAVEAAFMARTRGVTRRRAIGVSLLANGASLGLGLLLRATTGLV